MAIPNWSLPTCSQHLLTCSSWWLQLAWFSNIKSWTQQATKSIVRNKSNWTVSTKSNYSICTYFQNNKKLLTNAMSLTIYERDLFPFSDPASYYCWWSTQVLWEKYKSILIWKGKNIYLRESHIFYGESAE